MGDLDGWLASLVGGERDVSLVAVGSFGRGDRAPHSDLDLVLLHRSRRDVAAVAERVWYPIWDRGLRLDHSVRTVKEAVTTADGDLKVALGLLDARHVAGDPRLTADLRARVRSLWSKRARRWIPQLRDASRERHLRFGEVAFLLEPELKEGRGGLRDIVLLRSLNDVTTILGDLVARLDVPYADLVGVRVALQRRTGRALDRLLLQEQDATAAALDIDADALLARVSAAARTTTFVWDACWRRLDAWVDPKRRDAPPDRPLGPALALRDGEVQLHGSVATAWIDAAAAAAQLRVPLSKSTIDRMVRDVPSTVTTWPYGWRQAFVALLAAGSGAVPVLEQLDHHGLLARLLPEWDAVRAKPQRNAYHRYTVDRHLFEAAANAAAFARRVARPDLLLLGALLHDIGKGFPGDHTAAGVDVVERIGPRMGLAEADVAVLARLVEHHLLLPDTATRRDVDDPDTAAAVATAVRDRETLTLLAALTEADALATGPSAWSEWKARLVRRLVERTEAVLAGHRLAEPDISALVPPFLDEGIHGSDDRCIVLAPDRVGLFSAVAGVLALHGLDVLGATAGVLSDGRAVEIFDIRATTSAPVDWKRIERDVELALDGQLPLADRLAARARSYARPDLALAPPARVIVDNEASSRATVVEVRAPDAVAVLHTITAALAGMGLDIRSARVSTVGHAVVDAFYVVDGNSRKIEDAATVASLEASVLAALEREVYGSTRST